MKVSSQQLRLFVSQGLSGAEISRRLGVTEGCISKRLHRLNLEVKKTALTRAAGQIVEENINVIQQLTAINKKANALLDKLEAESNGGSSAPQAASDGAPDAGNGGAAGSPRPPGLGVRDARVLILRTMSEIRSQLELQTNIIKMLHDAKAMAEFQAETLAVIGEVDEHVRNRIIERLEQVRSSRLVLEFPA
jgi:hypothetical protein